MLDPACDARPVSPRRAARAARPRCPPPTSTRDNGDNGVTGCPSMSSSLLADVVRRGDRTCSVVSAYDHLRDHPVPAGRVRRVDLPGNVVAAGEPLCPAAFRADTFFDLARAARAAGQRAVTMPVGGALAAA